MNAKALIRAILGLLCLGVGVYWFSLLPGGLSNLGRSPSVFAWFAVIGFGLIFVLGGGFLMFFKNRLFKDY